MQSDLTTPVQPSSPQPQPPPQTDGSTIGTEVGAAGTDVLGGMGQSVWTSLQGENALWIGGSLLLLLVMALTQGGGDNKNKLARGVLASDAEKKKAQKRAISQMNQRVHNSVGVYVGTPTHSSQGKVTGGGRSLWIPDAQRGIAVCGAPGSGKTFSVINPVIRSSLDQGFPTIVYDFKYPGQTELLVGYAAKRGYKVRVFAPGYPESEVCNPLDFLRDENDALMARQMATVMNRNFALSSNSSEDKFFSDAGDQLTQALLMLTKSMPEPDLMTAAALLSMTELPKRIMASKELGDKGCLPNSWKMSNWVYLAFSQLLQLKDSEKTVAGVVGTAIKVFSRFLSPELVSAFCGKTTLPLDLEGKTLLILGLDRQRREAVAPLVATILHLIVTRNVTTKRKDPLVLAIDELPTLFLPYLTQWLNENRSDGLCTLIGFQNITQLEKSYSRETARSILGGCATKAFFNPQDQDSARLFSDYIGEEHLDLKQKSRSRGKGGVSNSLSNHAQRRAIVEPAQFNKLPTGKCVFINPGYQRKDEGSIPMIKKVKIPKADIAAEADSKGLWKKIRVKLVNRSPQVKLDDAGSKRQIQQRIAIAEEMLPLPPKTGRGKQPPLKARRVRPKAQ